MPEMSLAGSRYKYPISTSELDRRLNAVQSAMKKKGLDCCLAQTQSTIFDSVTRYLTDSVTHAYSTSLIIPSEGKITMVNHGLDNDNAPIPESLRNVEKLVTKPYCQPFGSTENMIGKTLAREINSKGYKKIGVIMKELISADTLDVLRTEINGIEFVNFSVDFSYIKAVKSPEELKLAERCVRAHEQLMAMVPAFIRPGRMEYEIIADIEKASRYVCCDWIGNIAVGSVPNGGGTNFYQNFAANRRIEKGDGVTVMIEVSGLGGLYGELARTFCLGTPDPKFVELYEIAKEAQTIVAASAKPGIKGKELNAIFNDFVISKGLTENKRFVGHSQGYDMMEGPAISPFEDMELRENMFMAIHPELMREGHFVIACDNYLITREGAKRLTKTPQEITVVEY